MYHTLRNICREIHRDRETNKHKKHQRRRKNDDLLNNHGDYRFFCLVCWIRLFKDDHKRNVCQNTLRLREAAIQYGSENGFPDQE